MELAMIGLGKMGMNMATRLVHGGHRVVGFALSAASIEEVTRNGGRVPIRWKRQSANSKCRASFG